MKQDSVKGQTIQYLRNKYYDGKEVIPAGFIEDYIRAITGGKGSTTDRRLRELENAGVIEKVQELPYKTYRLNKIFL